jgi:suppressor of fused protein SUFU
VPTTNDEFELRDPRSVDSATVDALDTALAAACGVSKASVLHAIDPRRILSFEAGGPAVWSVAVATGAGPSPYHLYVTYGLSGSIDPRRHEQKLEHELSIRIPVTSDSPPLWPTLLLRHLGRYTLNARRELRVGEVIPLFDAVSRAALAPEHKSTQPDSRLQSLLIGSDPQLRGVATYKGTIEVRRVYGIDEAERRLIERWSVAGFGGQVVTRDPTLTTDLERPSWTDQAAIVSAIEEGSAREGSATTAMAVPGVRWERSRDAWTIRLPGGGAARHLAAVLAGRLPHGRHLLVHDLEPRPQTQVALVPAEDLSVHEERGVLVLGMPAESFYLKMLARGEPGYEWIFRDG